MARTRVLSTEEVQKIIELYQNGISINHLYEEHGYSWSVVKKVLNEHGIPLRQYEKAKEVTQEEIEKVIKLHNEGMAPYQIAKMVNRNYVTINRILKKYDLETCQPRGKTRDEPENAKVREVSEIVAGTPIDCDTEGDKCIYRAPKQGCHLCDYCLLAGELRGGSPHECMKYAFE